MKALLIVIALILSAVVVCCVYGGQAIEVYHADSLAGPMKEFKRDFEFKNPKVTVTLTSGRSKELYMRILHGDNCDVFAPSDPEVIKAMFGKQVNGKDAASWYAVFSSNEMVVITAKGNPLAIKQMSDLYSKGVRVVRVLSLIHI